MFTYLIICLARRQISTEILNCGFNKVRGTTGTLKTLRSFVASSMDKFDGWLRGSSLHLNPSLSCVIQILEHEETRSRRKEEGTKGDTKTN